MDWCSPSLSLQLEGAKTFEETCEKNEIMEVLKLISGFCCKHDQNNDKYYDVFNSICTLFIDFQKNDQSNYDYLKEFEACMATLDDYNANVVDLVPCLLKDTLKEICDTTMDMATKEEIKKAKECMFK